MQVSDYVSIFALVISIVSIMIAWYFGFRDRAHLKTYAKFYPDNPNYARAHISIKIVNCGRRPVILTMFGRNLSNGARLGTYIGEKEKGVRLGEHEKYETSVNREDLYEIDLEGNECEHVNYWFENTLGQRYKVKNSEKLIKKLSESTNS